MSVASKARLGSYAPMIGPIIHKLPRYVLSGRMFAALRRRSPAMARMLMLSVMLNAMILGFLSSSHAAAQMSGMALICGPNGVVAIPLVEQRPDDLSLVDRERCVTACLAAMNATLGLVVEAPSLLIPEPHFAASLAPSMQALFAQSLENPKARGPPA